VSYQASIGNYEFDVMPAIEIDADRVVRDNAGPVEAVAVNYTITLTCRVRQDETDDAAAKLGSFLLDCVHTRTCPAVYILDSEEIDGDGDPTPIPEIGAIDEDAEDEDENNLGWEEPRVVGFRLPNGEGQLMAGASFVLTIQARRSFPDADGVCELSQTFEKEETEGGEVHRLVSRGRCAKASGATADTPAVDARLRLPAPVGWVRTQHALREPLYPLRHMFEVVSEVRLAALVAGGGSPPPPGATSARLSERVVSDPVKGILRRINTAETTGGNDPAGWVRDQAPSKDVVSAELSSDNGETQRTQGEWRRIESLTTQDKTTRVERVFTLRGGLRETAVVLMSPPFRPHLQRGPITPYTLTEQIEIRALAPTSLDDFRYPEALGGAWFLSSIDHSLPRVEEDALAPGQRLWVWVMVREYVWDSTDSPFDSDVLSAAIFYPSTEVLA